MAQAKKSKTVEAHQAHTRWHAEHSTWLDDVELWLEEYRRAANDLEAIAARVRGFVPAIQQHIATIQSHEDGLARHEHELAGGLRKGEVADDPQAGGHEGAITGHEAERDDHGRLKAKVHELVALVRKLEAATLEGPRSA